MVRLAGKKNITERFLINDRTNDLLTSVKCLELEIKISEQGELAKNVLR